jgi:hypothetical protein
LALEPIWVAHGWSKRPNSILPGNDYENNKLFGNSKRHMLVNLCINIEKLYCFTCPIGIEKISLKNLCKKKYTLILSNEFSLGFEPTNCFYITYFTKIGKEGDLLVVFFYRSR